MLEMYAPMVNSPITELANAIDAEQTTIEVVDGSKLPDAPNLAMIGLGENTETILYTQKDGNVLSGVTRGFQGIAKAWPQGARVARFFAAYDQMAIQENIKTLDQSLAAHLNEIVTEAAPGKIPRADANGKIDNDWLNGLLIGNNPACRVYTVIDQSVPDNGEIHIAFELEYFDNDNIHDVAVNNTRLTCRTPGKYLIIGQVVWEPKTSGNRSIGIQLNGSTIIGQVYGPPSPNGHCQQVVSTIFNLNAGNYVELRASASNVGSPIYIGGNPRPSFMMVKVG